jgi:hypothetical protein
MEEPSVDAASYGEGDTVRAFPVERYARTRVMILVTEDDAVLGAFKSDG